MSEPRWSSGAKVPPLRRLNRLRQTPGPPLDLRRVLAVYLMLLHLPDSHEATAVQAAMEKAIKIMPVELFKTLTWDRGKEMARHADIKISTGVQVYFCDPHSPWQRGSNENTNGLLRQVPPQGN